MRRVTKTCFLATHLMLESKLQHRSLLVMTRLVLIQHLTTVENLKYPFLLLSWFQSEPQVRYRQMYYMRVWTVPPGEGERGLALVEIKEPLKAF